MSLDKQICCPGLKPVHPVRGLGANSRGLAPQSIMQQMAAVSAMSVLSQVLLTDRSRSVNSIYPFYIDEAWG